MTHLDSHPLPVTSRHLEDGSHVPPHMEIWRLAADPSSKHYDPDRIMTGAEIEADQNRKAAFAAHLAEHRRRGEPAVVAEES